MREIEPLDRHLGAAVAKQAVEQRLARRLVAGDRVLGHGDQLQRHPAAQPQGVQRRPPGEAVEPVVQPLEQREAAVVADPDQPLARLDLASRPCRSPPARGGSPPQAPDIVRISVRPAAEGRGAGDQHVGARLDHPPRVATGRCRRRPRGRSPCRCASIRLRIASIFRSWLSMKLCPPKPGLTLITRTRSISSST